jgi:hypothetical protein
LRHLKQCGAANCKSKCLDQKSAGCYKCVRDNCVGLPGRRHDFSPSQAERPGDFERCTGFITRDMLEAIKGK